MFKLKEKQTAMLSATNEFISGTPIQQVMDKYHVSYASIYNTIKKHNLKYNYPGNRIIQFDTRYFQDINTEHKAYWLGFLFADGSIQSTTKGIKPNRVSLTVSESDKDILVKFTKDINMSQEQIKISYRQQGYKPGNFCYVYCNSTDMVSDLIEHGFTVSKKEREQLINVPSNLMHHFIRGYFDGDGSISTEFNITSEGNIVPIIYEILVTECNLPRTKVSYTKNSYRIRWGGTNELKRIGTYLYHDATIYIERKFNKFCIRCFHNE